MISSSRKTLDSFSKRFNFLLDKADFPPIGAGRAKMLADRFGGSKSGAQNWIGKNLPPKRDTLRIIVTEVLKEINGNYNALRVVAWLENGSVVANPFIDKKDYNINELPIASKHALLSKVYIAVHNIARSKNIDIYTLSDSIMDHVYNSVIRQALENDSSEPDHYLIESLLELTSKSAEEIF